MTQDVVGTGEIVQRWAFLVGIDAYVESRLNRLNFCVNDVVALEKILTELGYGVVSLYSEHPELNRVPTKENVEVELKKLCESVGLDDLLFVHFACHGTLSPKGTGVPIVLMQDSRESSWDIPEKRLAVTDVEAMMRKSEARRLVLSLDACHMGVEMGRGVDDDAEFIHHVYELAEGFVVMAGSTAQQKAQEWGAVKHGVYTYYLMKGLLGEADKSKKSFVSVDDLGKYVVNQLKIWRVVNNGIVQEPTVRSEGMGDMILADWRDRKPSQISIDRPDGETQGSAVYVREGTSVGQQSLPVLLSPEQLEKRELQKEYENLQRKYQLLSDQIAGELNEDNQDTLRARRESIKRKMSNIFDRL